MSRLADDPWPRVDRRTVLLVPTGSTEQHGPHLPLDVDTRIAQAVCERAAELIGGATRVAPPLEYGASGEHQAFAGTLSIGTEALAQVLIELARSARTWAERIVFVNAHGGNLDAASRARAVLSAEGAPVRWHSCRHGGMHADRAETSLMLHLDPARVDLARAAAGAVEPIGALLPRMREGGVRAVSPNGVLGDPAGANAAEGAALLAAMADDLARAVGA